jgi:hypothetical protein
MVMTENDVGDYIYQVGIHDPGSPSKISSKGVPGLLFALLSPSLEFLLSTSETY